ncbi:hypothetical protein [Sphingomonas panaciterrae]|uniref:hypothetical protein n=1 Tax=Sphingomonas panaciterrae TaxID=1462999 RepID=UPI002FEFFB5D
MTNRGEVSEGLADRVERLLTAKKRERQRAADLLERDRICAAADARREAAQVEVEDGTFVNLGDASDGPTPEQLSKGEFRQFTIEGRDGTVRDGKALRRVIPDRLVQLHSRGVLDDDTFAACAWYRKAWEDTGLGITVSAGSYTPVIRGGTPRRDHLPKSAIGWEAWEDYRFARDGIPLAFRTIVDLVVLDNDTIEEAARKARVGFRNASAAFRQGALELHGAIKHRLPVRQL